MGLLATPFFCQVAIVARQILQSSNLRTADNKCVTALEGTACIVFDDLAITNRDRTLSQKLLAVLARFVLYATVRVDTTLLMVNLSVTIFKLVSHR